MENEGKAVAGTTTEYAKTWDELDKAEAAGEKGDIKPPDPEPDTPKKDETDLPAKPASDTDGDGEPRSEKYGTVKSMEKALDDTKGYAHRLEQKNVELQNKLAEYESGKATRAEVDAAAQAAQDAQDDLGQVAEDVYKDYPELKPLLTPIIAQNKALSDKVKSLEAVSGKEAEKLRKAELLHNFEKNVKPVVLAEHSDFDEIVQGEAYWEWAKKQRPALRVAAMDSSDPEDINYAITEYKKHKASGALPEVRKKEEDNRNKNLKNQQTLRGGSTTFPRSANAEKDPNDYQGGWDEAGDVLKKQGVGTG